MNPSPWGDAKPLPGCAVIRPASGEAGVPEPVDPPASVTARKPANPVVKKIVAANRFYDGLATLSPRLSPLAVAVWGWLWRCERGGRARASIARLADRFGVSERTTRRALGELRVRGFVALVRRGRPGRPSVYRVRSKPRPSAATGTPNRGHPRPE